jgi:hypothetical protein
MTDQQILQELEALLEALGIHVRHETLEGFRGGICMINGRCCMFLDACTQPADLARLCAAAVMRKIDLDTMYLKPEVRRYLEETAVSGRTLD